MVMSKAINYEKFLTLILRHKPHTIGLTLNTAGWADIDRLVAGVRTQYNDFTREVLELIVENSDKNRFEVSKDGTSIRARQGHSVAVDLGLTPEIPPFILYHGTPTRNIETILEFGLNRGFRHAVHLTTDRERAMGDGSRRGDAVVLVIEAEKMYEQGHRFYKTQNNVWLTDHVPSKYISQNL
jgi:putative RNA 2'-phosphotransferase